MQNNSYESEKMLEENLIKHLVADGYDLVSISDIDDLKSNFRKQINKHNADELNGKELSDKEFERLLNQVEGKNVFNSAKNLRQKQVIKRDDGTDLYIELFNSKDWCKNQFQVTHQINNDKGKYVNRYDVTILINGLPLVQIELKRRGIDFKEAFDQVCRYKKHSLNASLFRYIQFFIISNGMDTKYFSNSDGNLNFEKTFYWSDIENNRIDNLFDFSLSFLPKCHVAKMIARYMVIEETNKLLMIMRPYQVYAVETLSDRATETNNNAYVWHTTGSGKTLTSFKLSQLLSAEPNIYKVFFLVDRKDLDSQTLKKFNSYQPDSVDSTDNTEKLIEFIKDPTSKLILTTIQKMSNACKNDRYVDVIDPLKNKKVIFIIDECHRSQFGDMHKIINKKFPRAQYFGFTGTPRFPENPSQDGRTTADIFEKCLHTYLIKDAIKDHNVLGWSVDYIKTINHNYDEDDDTKVEAIDTEEVIMADSRIELVAKNIIQIHNAKTRQKTYNALFTVKSIPMLIKYYDKFKELGTDLKIAAIYTYGQNEESEGKDEHSRDALERIIKDYNEMFETNYDTNKYAEYFKDVSNKVENGQIDILLVVNMFLTGFDAPRLNTLYIDKRMKDHDLIQAFSRTNRVEKSTKPYGNIVCYQTTKKAVDQAVMLFSQTNSTDVVIMRSMDAYIEEFKNAVANLKVVAPDPYEIVIGDDEEQLKKFVIIFRRMIQTLVKLETFTEFTFTKEMLNISRQEYEDYLSKYLAIARGQRVQVDKVSILSDVDFCLELIHNDKITVRYILGLIKNIVNNQVTEEKKKKDLKELLEMVEKSTDKELQLKAKLIENFINNIVPAIKDGDSVDSIYEDYLNQEREKEIVEEASKYGISPETLKEYISEYEFGGLISSEKIKADLPLEKVKEIKNSENIISVMKTKKTIVDRIVNFIRNIISKFM